jgi:hypothetical protein
VLPARVLATGVGCFHPGLKQETAAGIICTSFTHAKLSASREVMGRHEDASAKGRFDTTMLPISFS